MNENVLRQKIKILIKEFFEKTDNFETSSFDKEKAKEIVFAFIDGKIDSSNVRVEESKKMEVSDMIEKNDYMKTGHAYQKENPIIFLKYNHQEYSFNLEIDKEYSYETEEEDWNHPGSASSELVKIELTSYEIEVADSDGEIVKLTKSDLGQETFKKFQKTLEKFIE